MPRTPYLLHRGRRYYFRMRVPTDLVPFFCRRYIAAQRVGMLIATGTTESEERDIYTPEELQSIFTKLASHPNHKPALHPERVWLPMITFHD